MQDCDGNIDRYGKFCFVNFGRRDCLHSTVVSATVFYGQRPPCKSPLT